MLFLVRLGGNSLQCFYQADNLLELLRQVVGRFRDLCR
jgi:hypothetical protein